MERNSSIDVGSLIRPTVDASRSLVFRDDDVIDADGFRHCAKCGGVKEALFEVGEGFKPIRGAFMCRCQREESEKEEAKLKARELERLKDRRRAIALRSENLRRATFDNDDAPEGDKVSLFFRRYCEEWPEVLKAGVGIRAYGGVGTGKSFYAACACNYVIDHGYTAYFVTLPEIMRIASGFENASAYDELLKRLSSSDLVVLDDFGAQRDTSFALEKAFDAVNTRLETGKPTIVTTNLSDRDLKGSASLEERRIYDRIIEMCPLPVSLGSKSKRSAKSEERLKLAMKIMQGEKRGED